jgi:hypothetical protein
VDAHLPAILNHIIRPISRRAHKNLHNNFQVNSLIDCVLSASDVFLSKNDNSGRKTCEAFEGVEYDFYFTEYDFCPVITCSDFYPLSNQINLFMVINI